MGQKTSAHRKHGLHGRWEHRRAVCPAGQWLGRLVKAATVTMLGPRHLCVQGFGQSRLSHVTCAGYRSRTRGYGKQDRRLHCICNATQNTELPHSACVRYQGYTTGLSAVPCALHPCNCAQYYHSGPKQARHDLCPSPLITVPGACQGPPPRCRAHPAKLHLVAAHTQAGLPGQVAVGLAGACCQDGRCVPLVRPLLVGS